MRRLLERLRSEEDGTVLVVVAAMMTALMGLAALVSDVGRMYVVRQRLTAIADAAALSGSQFLPDEPDTARTTAELYLSKNGVDPATATVSVSADHRQVSVAIGRAVSLTFARAIGQREAQVSGRAMAETGNLSAYYGAAPLGVPEADWRVGSVVTLKKGGGGGTTGDYGALALGGKGASTYEDNLTNGYHGWIRVGDMVATEPGNMAGPTERACTSRVHDDPSGSYLSHNRTSKRLMVLPIISSVTPNGRGEVQVVGFAMFFVDSCNKGEVTGRFVKYVIEGESSVSGRDFGTRTTKLRH